MTRLEAITNAIAGIEPLGGNLDQLRISYSGTWDGPLFVTFTFSNDRAELVVVDPGEDFRSLVMAALDGGVADRSPSRRETRTPVTGPEVRELQTIVDQYAWTLGQGQLRGTDGHWITVEVFSPARGSHRGLDWCPPPGTPLARITAAAMRVAAAVDPALADAYWVTRLSQ